MLFLEEVAASPKPQNEEGEAGIEGPSKANSYHGRKNLNRRPFMQVFRGRPYG